MYDEETNITCIPEVMNLKQLWLDFVRKGKGNGLLCEKKNETNETVKKIPTFCVLCLNYFSVFTLFNLLRKSNWIAALNSTGLT